MSDFSLRLPYLFYLSIGSILVGVLIAPAFRDMPSLEAPITESTSPAEHMHTALDVPKDGAPEVALTADKDPKGGWNLTLTVENFTFTPEAVNGENNPNTGHAHVYVDGQKSARLYGPHFHLPDLQPGLREITVVLNSNDHSYYSVDGQRIEARVTVTQTSHPEVPES